MKPTQEQVIAWAWKAADGIMSYDAYGTETLSKHEFIELATIAYEAGRKDENEACAKMFDPFPKPFPYPDGARRLVIKLAAAIRARREQ